MAQDESLFRSSPMSLTQLYISNEIGREVVSALGELGCVQFRDLNPKTTAFQRTFTKEIRRLDNVERQLNYFKAQMEKNVIPMRSSYDFDENTLAAPNAGDIDELAERSQGLEQRISSLNESYETLKKREVELTEWRWVLKEAGEFFDRVGPSSSTRGPCVCYTLDLIPNIDRLVTIPMISDNRLTMMTPLCSGTLSKKADVPTPTLRVRAPLRS